MNQPRRLPNPVHPQGPDGRFAALGDNRPLNDMQAAFVRRYIENGGNGSEAARFAGYAPDTAGITASRLLDLHHVALAVDRGRTRRLAVAGAKAIGLVIAVLDDASAGLPLRLKAAEIALKADGRERDATRKTEQSKALNEMTVDELEAFIRRGREAAAQAQHPIIEGRSEPITSGDNPQPIDPAAEGTA